jgi:hypothetical protein
MVAVRLIVVSFVVGIVLETFGFEPATLFAEAIRTARQIVELGFSDISQVGRILLTGAMVVSPFGSCCGCSTPGGRRIGSRAFERKRA